jgi:hypothetical protein
LINGPSEGTNESCSDSSGLASLEMGSVAGGLSHKKDGIKQRKFKGPVPEVDVMAKGHRGLLNARALSRGLLAVACSPPTICTCPRLNSALSTNHTAALHFPGWGPLFPGVPRTCRPSSRQEGGRPRPRPVPPPPAWHFWGPLRQIWLSIG